ncbi:helix-turn-helix domain-containing protein [Sedimentimonas flavescens]|uniref:helix-turn-helix domain-containing protein n=1 Tax=Sedimentimonas flavescens TaxID=2851012 RepID=UPI001C4A4055|nr:helix-turn-helix domain-containing protein [Sedimentimonas flavescens]MBW0159706.1 helix-turn-helix domain-containing protein [Sedimentimonas flavescens]
MQHEVIQSAAPARVSNYWDGFIAEVEAADFLCQSVRTLQKWRVTGFGPQFYKPGRSVRYRRRDLRDWAEARRHGNTSQYTAT